MDRQAVFDRVARHLLTQNARSERMETHGGHSSPTCLYRGPNGMTCAIGCLIPDALYSGHMEGAQVSDIVVFHALKQAIGATSDDRDFLQQLQWIHDSDKPADWPIRLQHFAAEHNLTFAP